MNVAEALKVLPRFESAVAANRASYGDVIATHMTALSNEGDQEIRAACGVLFPKLRAAFESAHGHIEMENIDYKVPYAIALNKSGVWVTCELAKLPKPLATLIYESNHLRDEIDLRVTNETDKTTCYRHLYQLQGLILQTAGELKASKSLTSDQESLLGEEFARVRAYYGRTAERVAQLEYLRGMARGFAAICAVFAIGVILSQPSDLATASLLVALLGGASGAIISVLQRMTAGRLVLTIEASAAEFRRLGALRPVVGATFAIVVYAALAGGVVQLHLPPDAPHQFLVVIVVSFVSGFSERFAQDLLVLHRDDASPVERA